MTIQKYRGYAILLIVIVLLAGCFSLGGLATAYANEAGSANSFSVDSYYIGRNTRKLFGLIIVGLAIFAGLKGWRRAVALGCFLMHFGVYVADLKNIVEIILKLVFYATGIFYSVSGRIPAPFGTLLTYCNPMAYLIDAMRDVMLYCKLPNMWMMLIWFVISLGLSLLGIILCVYCQHVEFPISWGKDSY